MTSTISEFVLPRPALADCIIGMVVRDTRGCALDQTQRFNFYPRLPIACVGFTFVGDVHLIDQLDLMERRWTGTKLPSFLFSGAHLRPTITWSPGEAYWVAILFFPDALSAMTGLDLSSFAGRFVPAEEALRQPMLEACRNFFDAVPREGLERSLSVLQDKIEIVWAGVRPAGARARVNLPVGLAAEWIRSLVHRATATGSGRSIRQIQRRIKSWTGFGERDLHGFSHMEQLNLKMLEATRKGDVDWAALAAASGFADQAHMIRRTKQQTGFTPEQLRESRTHHEAFWYYRLFDQVAGRVLARQKGQ
jgi:AraC-like DNA-binding protein